MIVYPPPYERLVWDYKRANESVMNEALNKVDWKFSFSNKSINQQVIIFNWSVMNVLSNQILKIKLTIITTFIGNIWKKVNNR